MQSHGLAERSDTARDYDVFCPPKRWLVGDLSSGFEIPRLIYSFILKAMFSAKTQSGRAVENQRRAKSSKSKTAVFTPDFRDLKAGDYVVHADHGMGVLKALQTLMEGANLCLIYAENQIIRSGRKIDGFALFFSRSDAADAHRLSAALGAGRKPAESKTRDARYGGRAGGFTPKEDHRGLSATRRGREEFE